ncbi:hypothetical protein AZ012_004639 [Citrobacter amalonaticus]|nr:hypothetical protein AZ012_004639 [Citrobacter amalonaticus]
MDYVKLFLAVLSVWGIAALVGVCWIWKNMCLSRREFKQKREQFRKEWFRS